MCVNTVAHWQSHGGHCHLSSVLALAVRDRPCRFHIETRRREAPFQSSPPGGQEPPRLSRTARTQTARRPPRIYVTLARRSGTIAYCTRGANFWLTPARPLRRAVRSSCFVTDSLSSGAPRCCGDVSVCLSTYLLCGRPHRSEQDEQQPLKPPLGQRLRERPQQGNRPNSRKCCYVLYAVLTASLQPCTITRSASPLLVHARSDFSPAWCVSSRSFAQAISWITRISTRSLNAPDCFLDQAVFA